MSKFFYFKVTFLAITFGAFTGLTVYGLFDLNFSNTDALFDLIGRSLTVALVIGLVMGVINMFAKVGIPAKANQ